MQGWLEHGSNGVQLLGSPSVQLFLSEHEVSLYDLTEQILGAHSVHEGNVSPPPYAAEVPGAVDLLLAVAARAALWLHAQGYRGTASVDFVLLRRERRAAGDRRRNQRARHRRLLPRLSWRATSSRPAPG